MRRIQVDSRPRMSHPDRTANRWALWQTPNKRADLRTTGSQAGAAPTGQTRSGGAHWGSRITQGPNAAELLAGTNHNASERDRPVTVHPVSQSGFSPPQAQRNISGSSEPPRSLWRQSAPTGAVHEPPHDSRAEEPPPMHRTYGPYPPSMLGAPRYGAQSSEDMLRRSVDQLGHRVVEQYHAPPTSDPNSLERQRTEPLARSLSLQRKIALRPAFQDGRGHATLEIAHWLWFGGEQTNGQSVSASTGCSRCLGAALVRWQRSWNQERIRAHVLRSRQRAGIDDPIAGKSHATERPGLIRIGQRRNDEKNRFSARKEAEASQG